MKEILEALWEFYKNCKEEFLDWFNNAETHWYKDEKEFLEEIKLETDREQVARNQWHLRWVEETINELKYIDREETK